MHKLILAILLASPHITIAQITIAQTTFDSLTNDNGFIVNERVYNKGIYKTYQEFKYNKPSIVDNYSFDGKRLWLTDQSTIKLKKIRKREVWGFSDGARIFVSWRKYDQILEKGRYCYFREKGTKVMLGMSVFPPMILPIPVPYNDELVINFNTGKVYLLSKRVLKKILSTNDPELLTEFMKESKKGKKLFEYIIKYNKRNAFRIR